MADATPNYEAENKKRADEARKRLEAERKTREDAAAKSGKAAGDVKPTPTQDENDLAASGVHVMDKEPDGSEEQPSPAEQMARTDTRQMEARPAPAWLPDQRGKTRNMTVRGFLQRVAIAGQWIAKARAIIILARIVPKSGGWLAAGTPDNFWQLGLDPVSGGQGAMVEAAYRPTARRWRCAQVIIGGSMSAMTGASRSPPRRCRASCAIPMPINRFPILLNAVRWLYHGRQPTRWRCATTATKWPSCT
jgi:hypothetical protein